MSYDPNEKVFVHGQYHTKDEIEKALKLKMSLNHYIKKCQIELEKIEKGKSIVNELQDDLFFKGIVKDRYEFLACLLSKMKFLRDYPERQMVV